MQKNPSYFPLMLLVLVLIAGAAMYFVFVRQGSYTPLSLQELYPNATTNTPVTTPVPSTPPSTSTPAIPPPVAGMGALVGHLDIGPLCPVERTPPDPSCQPSPAQYGAYTMVVYNASRTTLVKQAFIDTQGDYRVDLSAGRYTVDISPHTSSRVGSVQGVPVTVTVVSGATVRVDISIDTGIR